MTVKLRHKRSGREASVTDALGRALIKLGSHEYVGDAPQTDATEDPPPTDVVEDAPRTRKRSYKRRDMQAE